MVTFGPTAGEALCFLAVALTVLVASVLSTIVGIKRWKTRLGKVMAIAPGAILLSTPVAYVVLMHLLSAIRLR